MSGDGRIAVVTGGSTGIGLATVRTLLEAGHRVAFFGHRSDALIAAREALVGSFRKDAMFARQADLRDPETLSSFFAELEVRWGRTADVLVCNAGVSPKGRNGERIPLVETSASHWNEIMQVNLTGAMLCCHRVLPGMIAAGSGRIILIGSIAGRTLPRIAGAAYSVSKAALVGLSRAIVSEYSSQGITANTICPGRILSGMTGDPDSDANVSALARIPVGRFGTPQDVARVVAFLASPLSSFINGAVIDVNGGEFTPS